MSSGDGCDGFDGLYTFIYANSQSREKYIREYKTASNPSHPSPERIYMEFKETEHRAYSGEYLDYDNMTATDFKYFTRIATLGRDVRAGRRTKIEASTLRSGYLDEYENTRERPWTDIIKITESCRVHLNGSDDPVFIAAIALRALWLITGDTMLEKKMREMEERNA